jgi:hypothetical protein
MRSSLSGILGLCLAVATWGCNGQAPTPVPPTPPPAPEPGTEPGFPQDSGPYQPGMDEQPGTPARPEGALEREGWQGDERPGIPGEPAPMPGNESSAAPEFPETPQYEPPEIPGDAAPTPGGRSPAVPESSEGGFPNLE